MNVKRILGGASGAVVLCMLGALAACGGSNEESIVTGATTQAVTSATVSLQIHDGSGAKVGTGSGVLIAPQLVLTSAHLVAGKAKWTVTTADGATTVTASRAVTDTWNVYNSPKAHPRKQDLAVLYLDKPIQLSAYPKLSSIRAGSGTKAVRFERTVSTQYVAHEATLSRVAGSPYSYVTDMPSKETLDTGSPVINDKGEILGVVMGRGMTTGKLYVSRASGMMAWMQPKLSCAGGKANLATKTSQPPPLCKKDAGGNGSSSGGSSGSGGGDDGKCGGGTCHGNCPPGGGDDGPIGGGGDGSSSGGSSGSSGASGSSSGSSGNDGTTSGSSSGSSGASSGSSGASSGGSSSGNDGTTSGSSSGSSGASSGGSSGSSGASSSGSSGNDGTTSSSGGGAGGSEFEDACEGPTDNPEVCPPETPQCSGPLCGGCNAEGLAAGQCGDNYIDFGDSGGGAGSSGGIHIR